MAAIPTIYNINWKQTPYYIDNAIYSAHIDYIDFEYVYNVYEYNEISEAA